MAHNHGDSKSLTRAVPLPHGVNGLKIGVTKTSTDWDDPPSSQSLFLNCGRYNLLGKRWKLIIQMLLFIP